MKQEKKWGLVINRFWKGIVFLAFFLLFYVFAKEILFPKIKKQDVLVDVKEHGFLAYEKKNYKKAREYLKEGLKVKVLESKEKILLASLFVQKNEIEAAERLVHSIPLGKQNESYFLIKSLIYMHQGDFNEAEKTISKLEEWDSEKGKWNSGILKFLKNEYELSLNQIEALFKKGVKRGLLFYLKNLNEIQMLSKEPHSDKDWERVEGSILESLERTFEYHQELYLLMAYVNFKKRDLAKTEEFIKKVLKEDPYFSNEYHYNSFIASSLIDWKVLSGYCNQIFLSNSEQALFNVFQGVCLFKTGNRVEGKPYIEKAKMQAPYDPIILSWYAYHLIEEGLLDQANEILEVSLKYNNLNQIIPYVLKGRLFEEKQDWTAALAAWEKVLSFNSYYVSGFGGVVSSYFHLEQWEDLELYKNQGLNIYPYSSRLLQVEPLSKD